MLDYEALLVVVSVIFLSSLVMSYLSLDISVIFNFYIFYLLIYSQSMDFNVNY